MARLTHHYLQRGFLPSEILALSLSDQLFYQASMEIEEAREKTQPPGA
jgi:hypothetical protein